LALQACSGDQTRSDPPVWNHQHKPKKICYKENNESNFKAISLSPFSVSFSLLAPDEEERQKRDRNNRRALGLARNVEDGGRVAS
jgi:hypothetical protein